MKAGPVIRKAMTETGKLLVKEAVVRAGEKASEGLKKGPEKIDDYINRKKREAIRDARNEAEMLIYEQMEIFEKRVDLKLDDIEMRIDEKIKSYYRSLLALVVTVIAGSVILGIIILLFLYLKKLMGL